MTIIIIINYYLLLLIGWEIKYTAGLCYVNIPGTTCFAHSSCTSLFILIFIKSTVDCIAHFILFNCTFYSLFYFYFILSFVHIFYLTLTYIYISSLVLCIIFYLIFLHCPLSGPVLTYISLLIIPCMIVYVTNKQEPWTLNLDNNQSFIIFFLYFPNDYFIICLYTTFFPHFYHRIRQKIYFIA